MLAFAGLQNQYRDAGRTDYTAAQEYEKTERIVPFGAPTQGPHTEPESNRDEWRAERDLEAQQEMAWWAMLLFFATVVGIALLAATLWETRRAAQAAYEMVEEARRTTAETAKSAKAAIESNAITRRAFFIEQRPWLRWKIPDPIFIERKGEYIEIEFDCPIENIGATPAMHLAYFSEMYCVPLGQTAVEAGHEYHREHRRGYIIQRLSYANVLPGETHYARLSAEIKMTELRPQKTGVVSIFLAFHAAYRFFESDVMAEIGSVYMVCRSTSPNELFTMSTLESSGAAVLDEVPGGRVIT